VTDVHSKKTRSYNMSRIKSKDTKPELLVRQYLFKQGFRYRLHDRKLPGKPDIVLKKYKTAIFVHGCFWHGHEGCRYYVIPKTRTEWWQNKIEGNRSRDIKNIKALQEAGWKVISIFECELKKVKRENTLQKVVDELH
jgi:DNA mismatch endonuclease, patch repair protein